MVLKSKEMVCYIPGCGKPGRRYGSFVLCDECADWCARILEAALDGATVDEIAFKCYVEEFRAVIVKSPRGEARVASFVLLGSLVTHRMKARAKGFLEELIFRLCWVKGAEIYPLQAPVLYVAALGSLGCEMCVVSMLARK